MNLIVPMVVLYAATTAYVPKTLVENARRARVRRPKPPWWRGVVGAAVATAVLSFVLMATWAQDHPQEVDNPRVTAER